MTTVERVAQAIKTAHEWYGFTELSREMAIHLARAAIEAMQEPNNKMLAAAAKAMCPEKRPTQKRVSVKRKHRIRYRAMIDAALEENTND